MIMNITQAFMTVQNISNNKNISDYGSLYIPSSIVHEVVM